MLSVLIAISIAPEVSRAQRLDSNATSPPIVVRLGSSDITPPEPLPLGGYTARGGKVCELPGDKLEARALILEKGGLKIAVVSADVLTIPESLHDQVAKKIGPNFKLFLTATHTHCAPDSQMLNSRMDLAIPGIAKFNRKWLDWYSDRISSAIKQASRSDPESLATLSVAFSRLSLNRGRRAFAQTDNLGFRVLDRAGNPLLTHYAAHAVLYGPTENHPRTDFPGFVRGSKGLFLPGAIGDMSPASTGNTPAEQVANFAKRFEAGPWKPENWDSSPLCFCTVAIRPPPSMAHPDFARLNRIPAPLAQSVVEKFAPKSGEVMAIRIGKLAIVGVPGEPTAELGRRIRSFGLGLGFRAVLTVSHCNGWMGYILSPEDYDRGGYEASLAFHGREFGNRIVEKSKIALRTLVKGL